LSVFACVSTAVPATIGGQPGPLLQVRVADRSTTLGRCAGAT
jgi:hypothetical protein